MASLPTQQTMSCIMDGKGEPLFVQADPDRAIQEQLVNTIQAVVLWGAGRCFFRLKTWLSTA